MHSLKARRFVLAFAAAQMIPLAAHAQADQAPPPPQLEKLEEGEAPAVTIRQPEQRSRVSEKRAPGGKVKEIKVSNGKNTYYLKPNDPAGSAAPGDAESNAIRGAQWEVLEFDLGQRARKEKQAEAAETAPQPPADAPKGKK